MPDLHVRSRLSAWFRCAVVCGLCASVGLGTVVAETSSSPSRGEAQNGVPAGFVALETVAPTIVQDLRYATANNFVGEPIDGYESGRAWLTREAAAALARVQADLAADGLSLKLYDAFRPQRAVMHFVRWARDLEDTRRQADYYPNVPKTELFSRGYIALQSGHSRGSTVDVTLLRRTPDGIWEYVDMGTPYDFFGPASWPDSTAVSEKAQRNRQSLRRAMERHGFEPYEKEWWHFTLRDEPFPDTYFDFPLR